MVAREFRGGLDSFSLRRRPKPEPTGRPGKPMIKSFKIKNFRCFRSIDAESLGRINVVVGRNASGKTTLLEAIFLVLGASPELGLRMRAWRGLGETITVANDVATLEELWADLFFQFDVNSQIAIDLTYEDKRTRTLRISHAPRRRAATVHSRAGSESVIPSGSRAEPASALVASASPDRTIRDVPLRFEWKSARGENFVSYPQLTPQGLSMPAGNSVPAVFFQSASNATSPEVAARFSRLSQRNEEGPVVEALREEFPFVRNLSIEVVAGSPVVQASIDGLRRKAPLGLVSSGVNKLLGLLVGIADTRGGVVLVDEIENGFYFDRLPAVWRLLLRFCESQDVQLFCTTHSYESISAIKGAIEMDAESFALLRVEGRENDRTVRSFSGIHFAAAVEENVEVR
jgi:predicted ATPase